MSWVQTPVGSNLGCIVLLSKSYLNQNIFIFIINDSVNIFMLNGECFGPRTESKEETLVIGYLRLHQLYTYHNSSFVIETLSCFHNSSYCISLNLLQKYMFTEYSYAKQLIITRYIYLYLITSMFTTGYQLIMTMSTSETTADKT